MIFLRQGPLILKNWLSTLWTTSIICCLQETFTSSPQSKEKWQCGSEFSKSLDQDTTTVPKGGLQKSWRGTFFHKDEKILSLLENWIHRELNTFDRAKIWLITQFLANCSQWMVVRWFRGVTPESPYNSSREGVSQETLHFTDGKCSALLYSEGVRQWLLSQEDFLQELCCPWSQLAQGFLSKCWSTSRNFWCRI